MANDQWPNLSGETQLSKQQLFFIAEPGNTYQRGRSSTVHLLIDKVCFVKKLLFHHQKQLVYAS
jgi:hypothetical protein